MKAMNNPSKKRRKSAMAPIPVLDMDDPLFLPSPLTINSSSSGGGGSTKKAKKKSEKRVLGQTAKKSSKLSTAQPAVPPVTKKSVSSSK